MSMLGSFLGRFILGEQLLLACTDTGSYFAASPANRQRLFKVRYVLLAFVNSCCCAISQFCLGEAAKTEVNHMYGF